MPFSTRHSPTAKSTDGSGEVDALRTLQRWVAAAFVGAVVSLAVIFGALVWSVVRLNHSVDWVRQSYEVLHGVDLVRTAVGEAIAAERGYVITGDEAYVDSFREFARRVDEQLEQLHVAGVNTSIPDEPLASLERETRNQVAELDRVLQLRRNAGMEAAADLISGRNGADFQQPLRDAVEALSSVEIAKLARRKQAVERSFELAKTIAIAGAALTLGVIGLAVLAIRQGFSARMRAERSLRQARDELEEQVHERTVELRRQAAIIEFSDDGIIGKDLQGIITSWNPGATRLFGYAAEEALGKSITILIPPDRLSEEPIILTRIARGEMTQHFETVRLAKDGRRIDVSVTISPIRDRTGTIVGASKIARDITERKHADSRLYRQLARLNLLQQVTRSIGERQDLNSIFEVVTRTLEEQMPMDLCIICLYEPGEDVLVVSSAGARSTQLAAELAMPQHARIRADENGLSESMKGRLVYEPDLSKVPFAFPTRLAQGGLRAMVAAPLLVESAVFGVLVAARRETSSFSSGDCEFLQQVSEHVALAANQAQLYSALQRAYDDLRQTQKARTQQERLLALGQMASGIAHDINNAISPVVIYTESLLERESGLSPEGRRNLETIQRAIDDVAQTVARMREFYRERDQQRPMRRIDLNALVLQVVQLTRARWSDMAQSRGSDIDVSTELQNDLPMIEGVENELRDAITNLVFNAVDAMPEGGTLLLRTGTYAKGSGSEDSADPRRVKLEVIDSGVGMDESTRRKCLEPFFTTKGARGSGLGLATTYGTIQRHGGDIEIESAAGEGTKIRLEFPWPEGKATTDPTSVSHRRVAPQRILLVDDDPLVLKALQDRLEGDGHEVVIADGGEAGIAAFTEARRQGTDFSVVITDLGMPYVDGRKVATAVKSQTPRTLLIMLTGWGQRIMSEAETPAFVDVVLAKPPKLRELREALARVPD